MNERLSGSQLITTHDAVFAAVIPPQDNAVPSAGFEIDSSPRDSHVLKIASLGRLGWQEVTGYGKRALVETAMGRCKWLIGERLRCRGGAARHAEAVVGAAVLNRMRDAARPNARRTRTASPTAARSPSMTMSCAFSRRCSRRLLGFRTASNIFARPGPRTCFRPKFTVRCCACRALPAPSRPSRRHACSNTSTPCHLSGPQAMRLLPTLPPTFQLSAKTLRPRSRK